MEMGAFSVSLAVKDLQAAQAFYEKLGFSRTGGDGKGYLIIKINVHVCESGATVGLFQGMLIERGQHASAALQVVPGIGSYPDPDLQHHLQPHAACGKDGSPLEEFTDVREIRESLLAGGIDLTTDTDPAGIERVSKHFRQVRMRADAAHIA